MTKDTKKDAVLSFIGADVEVEGSIKFTNSIRIDGKVNGGITGENGTLVIGQSGTVTGDIKVGSAAVMGVVVGNIIARERVDAYPPAKIKGDITAPFIGLEKGIEFSGNCKISPKHASK